MDEGASLFDPGVHRVPRDVHVSRCLRDGFVGKAADHVGRERELQWSSGPMHEQRPLRIEHY